jgi:hypothetical protein
LKAEREARDEAEARVGQLARQLDAATKQQRVEGERGFRQGYLQALHDASRAEADAVLLDGAVPTAPSTLQRLRNRVPLAFRAAAHAFLQPRTALPAVLAVPPVSLAAALPPGVPGAWSPSVPPAPVPIAEAPAVVPSNLPAVVPKRALPASYFYQLRETKRQAKRARA